MAKSGGNGYLKISLALIAIIGGGSAGGYLGYEKLKTDSDWHGKGIETLRLKQEHDMNACEVKFNAMKSALDSIAANSVSNTAKLDMLIDLTKEMKREVMK